MQEINDPLSIPITVITGFLGSGKTTLLSSLLRNNRMSNTAVIINEFGEVGLDHLLVEHSEENIIELASGCICCTIRGDLQKTLLELMSKRLTGDINPFNRLVIETTGLADPVPIIHTLINSFDLKKNYLLDGVITLVDAVNGGKTLDMHPEAVKQAAMAELIILSKTDLTDQKSKTSLINRLSAINPSVKIILSNFGTVSTSEIFGYGGYDPNSKSEDVNKWLAFEKITEHQHHQHEIDVNKHNDNIQAFALTKDTPVNMIAFALFRDLLRAKMGFDLLRVKGIINISGKKLPAVIHGVQHVFHPVQWLEAWPSKDRRTKLVFIMRNAKKKEIEDLFNVLFEIAEDKGVGTLIKILNY